MIMTQTRTTKSMKNAIFGIVGLLCNLIVSFFSRSVFIKILGVEYNGVNGLFTNVLTVLNLAELGFATSIAYALYKPLKEHDEKSAAMLMHYFAKIYRVIAIIVAAVGCCCIPFLQYLISEDISELSFSLGQLRIYFAMYLANTVCSYLLAYKRTIITADQNAYIISNVDNACNICLNVLQIVLLVITKNFYAFLGIMIAKTFINNIIIDLIARKRYPYLAQYKNDKLPKTEKSALFKNVQAMFCHRIGGTVIVGTVSIIISAFVSLIDAGKYGNYLLVINGVNSFINVLFNSVTASIGDLYLEGDGEHQYVVFKRISYLSDFLAVFTFVCYLCLFNDFIALWIGNDMQFDLATVIVISANAMIRSLRRTVDIYRDATGIFRQDWYKPLLEAAVGIGLAIGLSYVWGTFGVILGYTVATVCVTMPIENVVFFKYGLKRSVWPQVLRYFIVIALSASVGALTYFICSFIPDGLVWFIIEFLFVVIFSIGVFVFCTFRTKEFRCYCGLLKKLFSKKRKTAVDTEHIDNDGGAIFSSDEQSKADGQGEIISDKAENDKKEHDISDADQK